MSFHFPSKEAIVSYLKQHPLTSEKIESNPTEEKIIEAVADYFADQNKVSTGVDMGVIKTLVDLNLGISQCKFMKIHLNLTQALKDCANDKSFLLKK